MAHAIHEENLTQEEKKFMEYYQRANDLRKIELLRYAKYWYEEALRYNMKTPEVQERLDETNEAIRLETRSIIKVVIVAAVLIAASILIF